MGLRRRGTVLLLGRDGKVLLVMDKGHHKWSLPGGGVESGERSGQAATREMREEVGLSVRNLRWLGHFDGAVSRHSIYFADDYVGSCHLRGHELSRYMWWSVNGHIDVYGHVWEAIRLAKQRGFIN